MNKEIGDFERKYKERRDIEKLREFPSPLAVAGAVIGGVVFASIGGPLGAIGGTIAGGALGQVVDRKEAARIEAQRSNSDNKL